MAPHARLDVPGVGPPRRVGHGGVVVAEPRCGAFRGRGVDRGACGRGGAAAALRGRLRRRGGLVVAVVAAGLAGGVGLDLRAPRGHHAAGGGGVKVDHAAPCAGGDGSEHVGAAPSEGGDGRLAEYPPARDHLALARIGEAEHLVHEGRKGGIADHGAGAGVGHHGAAGKHDVGGGVEALRAPTGCGVVARVGATHGRGVRLGGGGAGRGRGDRGGDGGRRGRGGLNSRRVGGFGGLAAVAPSDLLGLVGRIDARDKVGVDDARQGRGAPGAEHRGGVRLPRLRAGESRGLGLLDGVREAYGLRVPGALRRVDRTGIGGLLEAEVLTRGAARHQGRVRVGVEADLALDDADCADRLHRLKPELVPGEHDGEGGVRVLVVGRANPRAVHALGHRHQGLKLLVGNHHRLSPSGLRGVDPSSGRDRCAGGCAVRAAAATDAARRAPTWQPWQSG